MLTAEIFRKVRLREMQISLEGHGFQRGKDNVYWREMASTQIHSLKFATGGRFRNFFAVELGFHYSFVPPVVSPQAVFEKERFSPYKCCLKMRLLKPNRDQFFDYGETVAEAEQMLRDLASQVVSIFAAFEQKWSDGRPLLAALTPAKMEADRREFADYTKYEEMQIRKMFCGWYPHVTEVCVLLGFLALRFGRVDDAIQYRKIAMKHDPATQRRALAKLKREIDKSVDTVQGCPQ